MEYFNVLQGNADQFVSVRWDAGWRDFNAGGGAFQCRQYVSFESKTGKGGMGRDIPTRQFVIANLDPGGSANTPQLITAWDTNTNTNTYNIAVWGYLWEEFVRNLPGGPRRPGWE